MGVEWRNKVTERGRVWEIFENVCIKTAFWGAIILGRFCSGIDQFLAPSSPFFKLSNQRGDGGMRPCVPLSYTSDGGVARICQRGRGGGQYGNFCTLNAIIRGRLCRWHRPIPYSSFFNSSINRGHGPAPCAPLATPVNNMQQRTWRRRGGSLGRRACRRIM